MGKYKNRIVSYHNVQLCKDCDLADALGVSRQAISCMSNKKKRFLLKLGLTYKKALDNLAGGEEFSLSIFDGSDGKK